MALVNKRFADEPGATRHQTLFLVDFDSSYPVGGEPLSNADLGFTDPVGALYVQAMNKNGYSFEYDGVNGMLKVLTAVKRYTAAVDPASALTDTVADLDVTVTGVAATDICIAAAPVATLEAGMVLQSVRVKTTDTITVRAANTSAGTVNAASGTWAFYVIKANGAQQEVPDTTDLSALTNVPLHVFGRQPS